MNSVYRATLAHGDRMLADPAERAEFRLLVQRYAKQLRQLERAQLEYNSWRADRLTQDILGSFGAKLSAVTRTRKHNVEGGPVSLAVLKKMAAALDPYHPVNEPVRALYMEKGRDDLRIVCNFGPKRRALQLLCADILGGRLPAYDFDFMEKGHGGADGAAIRLQGLLKGGANDHVVTADIENCFGSVNKEGVVKLLPLPELVVRNVLLIQDAVEVIVEPPTEPELLRRFSLGNYSTIEADTAAWQGLPQGSSASNLIMSRAVLGPLLNAAPFASRLTLYGDDIAVVVEGGSEANSTLHALRSILGSTLAGPLTIGRHNIQHTSERSCPDGWCS